MPTISSIILATGNPGKVKEFQIAFANSQIEILPQSQFNVPEVAETGLTYIENAIIKARHAARHTGLPALADDSGVEVAALNDAPGIYSARYAGEKASADENNRKLLQALNGKTKRQAKFQCVLAFLRYPADPSPIICQGTWQGEILLQPVGNQGFGYEPIFYIPTHQCSAAQLNTEIKNQISHRGLALQQMLNKLYE